MLLTTEEIRKALRKTTLTEAEQELVDFLHPLTDAALKVWIEHELEYSQHVELLPAGERLIEDDELMEPEMQNNRVILLDQTGGRTLHLSHTPVWNTGLTVYLDKSANAGQASDAFAAATLLTQGTDYWLDIDDHTRGFSRSGILYHSSVWPNEPRTVKVTYYGGDKLTTADIIHFGRALKLAAVKTFLHHWHGLKDRATGGVVQSERLGEWSATYAQRSLGTDDISIPAAVQQDLWKFRRYSYL